jgi:hypothetical protein
MSPGRGLTPRQTGWRTVSCKVAWTWSSVSISCCLTWRMVLCLRVLSYVESTRPLSAVWSLLCRYFLKLIRLSGESGSSVSIVSGYGLDDREIEVRSLARAKDFSSSFCVQTGSGTLPASCPMGTECPFPGGKARPWPDANHSPPSSAEVENE